MKKRIPINKEYYLKRKKYCIDNKIPYVLTRQGNSKILSACGIDWFYYSARNKSEMLPSNEINFIGRVKKYIVKNNLHETIPILYKDKDNIKFIDYNRRVCVGEVFNDCYCVDINSAYWTSALTMGYINEKIYMDGLTKDKRIRLACLGTFAKTVDTYEFDGENEEYKGSTPALAEHVFFNQAYKIYRCMNDCKKAIKNDFLFYWTDCVYAKDEQSLAKCIEIMANHGFDSKVDKVREISFKDSHIQVLDKVNSDGRFKDKRYELRII